jgi:7,8-dihydro-6-hydroxymethylpterin-pyrophosphokinase
VLQPLSEIAPDFILPGQGRTVAELLAGLPPDETITKL